jgi:hypothetical protein
VDTGDSNFDTRLAVYRGNSLPDLSLIAVNDDEAVSDGVPLMKSSRITFNAQGGTTYHIQVGGVGSERGQIRLSLIGPDAPTPQLAATENPESEGGIRLALSGTPGQTIWIQSSENLVDWRWTGILRFEQETEVWTDPETPAPAARFYRIISPQ